MAELTGQTFAGYEILAKLGQGGMGAVYKARQQMLNRLVALKMMAPNLSGDPAFVARFIREASAAANLNHPNMVQVYTAGENDKIYYIAMEFVEGESLRIRLDRMGRIPPQEAVAITVYIAQALQYAWNKAHLIHRDIKPDNIFLSNAGEVKVGDLGLAKSVGGGETTDMTQTGMVMGSPHYISPEQAQGLKDIDFRTDIYSLGCTLYHMLTGQTPYHGDSSMIVMMKHINDPPPAIFRVWPACPMPLGMLVGKMLAKDRNARPQSYEELVADLMQVHEKLRQSESIAPVATTPAPTTGAPAVSDTVPKAKATDAGIATQAKAGNQKLVYAAAGVCAAVALAGFLWWSPWKSGEEASGKRQTEASSESRLQAESTERPPAKAETPTAAPAEPPRQETVAPVTSPAPTPPPAPAAQFAPVVSPVPTAPVAPSQPEAVASTMPEGFQPLFNGRDLTGWSPREVAARKGSKLFYQPTTGGWMVQNGELLCASGSGGDSSRTVGKDPPTFFLKSNGEYGDFILQLEFKLCPNGHGGLYIRCSEAGNRNISVDGGMKIPILDAAYAGRMPRTSKYRTGAIAFVTAEAEASLRATGQWNSMEIRCEGDNVEVTVNGTRTATANMSQEPKLRNCPRSGYIAIANWCCEANGMTFRNIRIKELGTAASQVSTQRPKDTLVLFDGKDCSAWEGVRGQACPWRILDDGSMETVPKSGDIATRQKFRDFQMHVEFWLPLLPPDVKDQKRANSGIFLQGLYEIQVLDSYNNPTYPMGGCCAIYKIKEPDNADKAVKPPETWNTYDITFRAARFDAAGNKTANARVTVLWNGVKAHDNVELPEPTLGNRGKEDRPGSIRLQDHGNKVRYRNIWTRPLEEDVPMKNAVSTSAVVSDPFIKEVAALSAAQQVACVVAKLKELNPNFDGKETHKFEGGAVTELAISTVGLRNLAPVGALKQLKKLTVAPWTANQKGVLTDLAPLRELPLTWLYCQNNPISDFSPLKGLPLTVLGCGGTQVSDLSPLAGMKLTVLSINDTAVSDLSPLSGMPLTVLWCNNTRVSDFAPLGSSPLQELRCDFQLQRDAEALRGIPTLRKINDQAAATLLRQLVPGVKPGAASPPATGGDFRVLIVTGVDLPAHDWRSTGPTIRNELQKDPRMKVEILNDPYRLDSMDLAKFQVVLLNFYTKGKPDPNEQAKDNLKNFVNRGGGLVVFHSTCGSFRDWPEFRDLAGKIMSHQKPAMDKVGPMRVKIVNQNHPITRGMQSYETVDELYAFLTGRKPVEVLATAHAKSTGSDEPMAFVLTYDKGRVFHIVLGHTVGAIQTHGTAELIRRGTAWVAGREPAPLTAAQQPLR